MADGLSDHTITHQLELYQALPIPQQLHNLCKLVATVHDGGSGPSKLLVQGSLCQALLKSLQGGHSPQEHDTFTLAEAWNACSSAFELIYTWEEEQVVLSVIQSWAAVSNLLCGSWLQQDQPMSCDDSGAAARPHTTTTGVTCAASDTPAGTPTAPAVAQLPSRAQHQYLDWLWSLGHGAVAAVVQQLHQFWKVTGIKHLQYQQQQQQQPRGVTSQLTSLLLLFLELHHSPPAVCSSSSDSSSQPVAQLLQLLYGKTPNAPRSTPAALTAAEAMSGVCCLLQAAAVLHVTTSSSQHTSAQTPGKAAGPAPDPMDLEESNPAAAAASIQHTAQLGSAAAPTAASAAQAWPQLAETAGRLLRDHYGWCGFGEAANMSASAAAAASEAARYTAAGYGSSPAGGVCRPSSVESLYDCFMVLLVQQMMQGPHTTSTSASFQGSGGHSTRPATSVVAAAAAAATLTAAEAPEAAAAAAGEEAVAGLLSSSLREDEWEGWLDSEVFSSLAALVATYDRPGALVRALHILTQQQLMADDMAAVAATAAAAAGGGVGEADLQVPTADSQPDRASKLSAKQASKSAMCRVLLLVEKIFLWRHHRQQQQRMQEGQSAPELTSTSSSSAAAAAGVCQLLLGLSELLRPAANCSVEWRCAALTSMLAAVEDFLSEHPGVPCSLPVACRSSRVTRILGMLFFYSGTVQDVDRHPDICGCIWPLLLSVSRTGYIT